MAYKRRIDAEFMETHRIGRNPMGKVMLSRPPPRKLKSHSALLRQFTKKQLEHLYKLFYPKMTANPPCSTNQKNTYLIAALFSTNRSFKVAKVIDSRATDHVTDRSRLFSSYGPCAGN